MMLPNFEILFTPPEQYFILSHFVGRFKMQAGMEVQQSGYRRRRRRISSVYHEKNTFNQIVMRGGSKSL